MVVTDTCLVAGCRPRRLDAPDDACVYQRREGVVDRLLGDGADLAARDFSDDISRGMRPGGHGLEHRQALGSYLHAMAAQDLR